MTIGYTQADVDALRAAIASGVQSVSYAGPPARSVTYASLSDMRAALAEMIRDVAAAAGGGTTRRLVQTSKGFDRVPRGGFRRNE